MAAPASRDNQRRRTRKDLLAAAGRLLKTGRTPSMDEVAAAAMVSRATAYRYFPAIEALLAEAPVDDAVPTPDEVFAGDASIDPVARIEKAESLLHEVTYRNEAQLRLMLAASMERRLKALAVGRGKGDGDGDGGPGRLSEDVPLRQNRRTGLIEAALAPARGTMSDAVYEKLCASLALIFGTESMIVFRDVLGVDEKTARRVKKWALAALVEKAVGETPRRR